MLSPEGLSYMHGSTMHYTNPYPVHVQIRIYHYLTQAQTQILLVIFNIHTPI